jgi:hypothetical protein
MSTFPTNKTVPLDKDIAVADPKTQSISTGAREQLSVVLDALDSAIASTANNANTAVSNEATARQNADANLQSQINSEITNRTNADTAEASARATAVSNEASARSAADTILQNEIDGERAPLKATATGTDFLVSIAAATQNRIGSNGATTNSLGVPSGVFQSDFAGASINFSTGAIVYSASPTPPNSTFTLASPTGQANKWTKYSVVLLPTSPDTLLISSGGVYAATAGAVPSPVATGGIPIAIVAVQVNSGATGFNNVTQSNVLQFIAAGAGGSGSGSGSPLDPQADETFTYYTRSDFATDAKKFFASTTGAESILGLKKVTLGVGQQLLSTDLTGPQFRADGVQINQAQARLMYNSGKVDTNPIVDFSRDGGLTWTIGTNYLLGTLGNIIESDISWATPIVAALDSGTANGTLTSGQKVAAIVTPTYRLILSQFSMNVRSAATAGTVVGKIYTVNSGIPNSLVATSIETFQAGQDFSATPAYLAFSFKNISLESGTQYALAIEGTGLNANISVDQVTSPAAFSNSNAFGTGSYSANAASLAVRLFGQGGDLRLRITSGTAGSELTGFGVEYVSDSPAAVRGDASYELRTLTYAEASTGLITLNGVRFTPGAHQLLVIASNHIITAPDFTELSASQVQFPPNFFQQGDIVAFYNAYGLVDGSSQSLGKINLMYDAVVGSASQVAAGYATHTSLQTAINNVATGSLILLLGSVTENITLSKNLIIEGKGYSSSITGTFALSANYATIRDVRFGGNLNITGSGNFIRDSFIASTASVSDTGTANSKLIILE